MALNLVLLGPPGVGKGTQGRILAERLGVPWLSSGDILRDAVRQGSELGERVGESMRRGDLVDDAVIVEVMWDRLQRGDASRGFILDGFPRTRSQAEALSVAMDRSSAALPGAMHRARAARRAALLLDLPDEEVVRRLSGRRTCPDCGRVYHVDFDPPQHDGICDADGAQLIQRDDDRAETIRRRLGVYHQEIGALLGYYEEVELLRRLDGGGPPDAVAERLARELESVNRAGG